MRTKKFFFSLTLVVCGYMTGVTASVALNSPSLLLVVVTDAFSTLGLFILANLIMQSGGILRFMVAWSGGILFFLVCSALVYNHDLSMENSVVQSAALAFAEAGCDRAPWYYSSAPPGWYVTVDYQGVDLARVLTAYGGADIKEAPISSVEYHAVERIPSLGLNTLLGGRFYSTRPRVEDVSVLCLDQAWPQP